MTKYFGAPGQNPPPPPPPRPPPTGPFGDRTNRNQPPAPGRANPSNRYKILKTSFGLSKISL